MGGILTPTGVGTLIEEGKQKINLDGKDYLLETALTADFAIIKGYQGDPLDVQHKIYNEQWNSIGILKHK